MKKVIMTAALAIAAIGAVQAQNNTTYNGTYTISVSDFLNMSPQGPFAAGPLGFTTPTEMAQGKAMDNVNITVEASRSWGVTVGVGNFTTTNANTNVSTSIPAGDIMTLTSSTSTSGVNVAGTVNAQPLNNPRKMAWSNGGVSKTFNLTGMLTPGFGHNMSGTYVASIEVIASLD